MMALLTALVVGATGCRDHKNSAAALTWPETHARTTPMALKETAADLTRASAALSGQNRKTQSASLRRSWRDDIPKWAALKSSIIC